MMDEPVSEDAPGTGTTQGSLGIRYPGQKDDRSWKRVLIVYESVHHGNTRKMAEAMAEAVNREVRANAGHNGLSLQPSDLCRAIRVRDASPRDVEAADVVGFGSGIYFGRHHRNLLAFVSSLPPQHARTAFFFSTKGRGPDWWYDRALRRSLESKGFRIVGSRSWKALDTYGPWGRILGGLNKGHPDKRDLSQAARWACEIVMKA